MATKAKKASARKKTARSAKGRSTTRATTRRASARKGASARKSTSRKRTSTNRKSPVARVKRVTREVVQQATVAVTAGVETLKDLGEQLVDRVRA